MYAFFIVNKKELGRLFFIWHKIANIWDKWIVPISRQNLGMATDLEEKLEIQNC